MHEWFLSQRLNADEPKDKEYRQHFAPTELEYLRDIEIQASLLSLNSRFIESSKREYSTTELPATLEALVRTLGPEVGVIVRPQNEYGYQYNELVITSIENNSFSLKPLLGAPTPPFTEESLLEGLPRRIGILTFPKIEANNVLLHSFGMAHELGHLVDEVLGFSGISPSRGDSLTVAKSDASASALLRTSEQTFVRTSDLAARWKNASGSKQNEAEIRTDLLARVWERAWRWLTEVVADTVATVLAGPATIAGFLWLVQTGPEIEPSYWHRPDEGDAREYPEPRLRLRAMFAILDHLGFTVEVLSHVAPKLTEWLVRAKYRLPAEDAAARQLLPVERNLGERELTRRLEEEISAIVTTLAEEAIPEAFGGPVGALGQLIVKRLSSITTNGGATPWVYTPDVFREEVRSLFEDIRQRRLPCQKVMGHVIAPARFASILNAGWESWITSWDGSKDVQQLFTEQRDLNDLLRTALEASQIHRRFLLEQARG